MIKKLLDSNAIFLKLESNYRDEALLEISKKLQKNGFISDVEDFLDALKHREELMNTSLNNGIAVPHGISATVIKPVISIALSQDGIDWNSDDLTPINIIFTIALQKSDKDLQIDALQLIALYSINDRFSKEILKATTQNEALQIFLKHFPDSL